MAADAHPLAAPAQALNPKTLEDLELDRLILQRREKIIAELAREEAQRTTAEQRMPTRA